MSNITEDYLDQLDALRRKRLNDIAAEGIHFRIANSEKTITAVFDPSKKTLTAAEGTPIHPGQLLEHPTTHASLYVHGTEQKAGVVVAHVAEVVATANTFERQTIPSAIPGGKAASHLVQCGLELPIMRKEGAEITIPAHRIVPRGAILKVYGSDYEVVGHRRDGAFTVLAVRSYTPPAAEAPQSPTQHPFRPDIGNAAPSAAPVRGLSIYGW